MSESIGENTAASVIPMGPKLARVILDDAMFGPDRGLAREIVEGILVTELGPDVVPGDVSESIDNVLVMSRRLEGLVDDMLGSPCRCVEWLLDAAAQVAREIGHHPTACRHVQVRIVSRLQDFASDVDKALQYGWHQSIHIEATVGEGAPARKEQDDER
jgi:hypothetical protein